jgi:hypothetical protein
VGIGGFGCGCFVDILCVEEEARINYALADCRPKKKQW